MGKAEKKAKLEAKIAKAVAAALAANEAAGAAPIEVKETSSESLSVGAKSGC